MSIVAFTDEECEHPYTKADGYTFGAMAYIGGVAITYDVTINAKGELMFKKHGTEETPGLIALGNNEGVAIHRFIPVRDDDTPALYIKAFEQNVETGF